MVRRPPRSPRLTHSFPTRLSSDLPVGEACPSTAYRRDIDGLCALAVLPVLFYHVDLWPFSGGFVGVDIFFVISGYLIASIIGRELAEGRDRKSTRLNSSH